MRPRTRVPDRRWCSCGWPLRCTCRVRPQDEIWNNGTFVNFFPFPNKQGTAYMCLTTDYQNPSPSWGPIRTTSSSSFFVIGPPDPTKCVVGAGCVAADGARRPAEGQGRKWGEGDGRGGGGAGVAKPQSGRDCLGAVEGCGGLCPVPHVTARFGHMWPRATSGSFCTLLSPSHAQASLTPLLIALQWGGGFGGQ